jgi:outer membrane lipoprotein-sorting protein
MRDQAREEARIADALSAGLGRLRDARPDFQQQLEARLLQQLAEPPRPWWRRIVPARRPVARPIASGGARLSRRSMLGVAAASAIALTAASLSIPLVGAPEVSAREILDKAQANAENPVLAGVKSFHLTATVWSNVGPKGAASGPREMATEQWFVAPDRMRTETRTKDASGKPVVSGMLMNGTSATHYATDGAADVFMVSVFAAPIGAKVPREAQAGPGQPGESGGPTTVAAGVHLDQGDPPDGEKRSVMFVAARPAGDGAQEGNGPSVHVAKPEGDGKPGVSASADGSGPADGKDVVYVGENCPEPTRTGEGTIAGRPVFVIQNDFSACVPADAPDALRGRHVRWVDQKTYLPLKLETYDSKGALVDRYEVTAIEYDVSIPEKTLTEAPAGTTVRDVGPLRTGGPQPGQTQERRAP